MDRFNEKTVYNTPDFKETFRRLDDPREAPPHARATSPWRRTRMIP